MSGKSSSVNSLILQCAGLTPEIRAFRGTARRIHTSEGPVRAEGAGATESLGARPVRVANGGVRDVGLKLINAVRAFWLRLRSP